LLTNYKIVQTNTFLRAPTRDDGMAFIQQTKPTAAAAAEKKKKTNSKGESHCFNWGAKDHCALECTNNKMTDEQ